MLPSKAPSSHSSQTTGRGSRRRATTTTAGSPTVEVPAGPRSAEEGFALARITTS
jgi:hypothetical protein